MTKCPRGSQPHKGRCISIDHMINSLGKRINGQDKFFNGNCGNFAIGLKRVLGRGELVGVSEEYQYEGLSHVALKVDGIYYDGDGAVSKKSLKEYGRNDDHPRQKIELVEGIEEDDVMISTSHISGAYIEPEWFEKEIRKELNK